jgi:hemoglobin/transferrin/lactoferrin receptor protein
MKNILFFLCVSFALNASAQTITIKDVETGKPLEMATVSSESGSAFSTSDKKGKADISGFSANENIVVQMLGYKVLTINISALAKKNYQIFLNPVNFELDQVVVSATKWRQSAKEVPQHIARQTAKDIEFQSPQTSADLLAGSGEVFVQKSQQGGGSPMIRGFSTNRLLLTVDGVRMNNAIFRGGNIQNVVALDAFSIEQTEVVFGPGSTIYGSDAIGGVMNFYTLKPQFSDTDETLVTGSMASRYATANNEKAFHGDVNIASRKWSFLTSFSYTDFDNLKMGKHGPDDYLRPEYIVTRNGEDLVVQNENPRVQVPSGYTQANVMQKIRFKPNEKWDFTYAFHYSESSDVQRYDRLIQYRNDALRSAQWYYGPQKWMMNHFNIDYTSSKKLFDNMSIKLAHQHFEESRHDRVFGRDILRQRFEMVNAYSANIDFLKKINEKHQLGYGAELIFNDVISLGTDNNIKTGVMAPGATRYPMALWASYAAYVNYQYKISDKLVFSSGMRYNQFTINAEFDTTFYPFPFTDAKINNGALTGSAGLVYSPNEKTTLSTNVSTGFRAPNVDDIGKVFDSQPGTVTVPNPNLKSEYVYNVDAGIARVFSDKIRIDATAFYTHLQNAMVRRDYVLNGMDSIFYDGELSQIQAIQNGAKAKVYGVQAGVEIKIFRGLSFYSRVNFQRGEEELEDGTVSPSRHAAPMYGVSRLAFSHKQFRIELNSFYSAAVNNDRMPFEELGKPEIYARDANGNLHTPAWYTLNLRAMYNFYNVATLTVGLENITNRRYRPYSSGISAPGINFVVSARVKF